jgi:DNA invertase Pin-like site-specific DNA recombinase
VALYARVSTRDKEQDPELQLHPLREYAAARGWRPTEYVDRAPAGDLTGRAAWARLLADVRRRRVDLVLAWKLDRPFRSTLHCLSTLQEWDHRGVGFACLTQEIDTTSPTGRLLLTLLAAVAEFERYADVGITLVMPRARLCRPGAARERAAFSPGRDTRAGRRHNHRPSRKARRLSGGR